MVQDISNAEALAILDGLPAAEYALHGSTTLHEVLKSYLPRQHPDLLPEYRKKAVHGTLVTEVALMYATILESQDFWGWQFKPKKRPHLFLISPARTRISAGYVYICKRTSFVATIAPGLVCLSPRQVKPVRILRIQPNILEVLGERDRLGFRERR